jgi:hypothetical protein
MAKSALHDHLKPSPLTHTSERSLQTYALATGNQMHFRYHPLKQTGVHFSLASVLSGCKRHPSRCCGWKLASFEVK